MKNALVYGRGVSGRAAEKLLLQLGYNVAVFCDGEEGEFKLNEILKVLDLLVVSPSVPPHAPLVVACKEHGIKTIGETELGYLHTKSDIIAITGTNGKTSTTMLMAETLKKLGLDAHALGNIGVPLSEKCMELIKSDVVCLEISSFQLSTCDTFRPKIGVCLNISPDHLDYHGSYEEYAEAKKSLFKNLGKTDKAVLNFDDPIVKHFSPDAYYFSTTQPVPKGVFVKDKYVFWRGQEFCEPQKLFPVKELGQRGEHNTANALAVLAVCLILNYPADIARAAIAGFVPPRHRLEKIATIKGVTYFNDSKATNVDAAEKACSAMCGRTALLMGGFDKGLSYKHFLENMPKHVIHIICYGENRFKVQADVPKYPDFSFTMVENLKQAVLLASGLKVLNVLLAPATSSYDSYANYAVRGDHFVELVRGLL